MVNQSRFTLQGVQGQTDIKYSSLPGITVSQDNISFNNSLGSAPDIICLWTQEKGPAMGFQSDPDISDNPDMFESRSSSSSGGSVGFKFGLFPDPEWDETGSLGGSGIVGSFGRLRSTASSNKDSSSWLSVAI